MPTTLHFLNLFLVFIRILTVLMTAPLFNNKALPRLVKIGLAGVFALIFLPLPEAQVDARLTTVPTDLLPFVLIIFQEILVGIVIGYVGNLVFMAIGIAASMMGVQTGFRAANLFDPFTNVSSSALNQFYTVVTMALFLAIDGHHLLIRAIFHSFEVVPIGTFIFSEITMGRIIFFFNETFVIGVTLALPVVGALLLTDLGLGLISRAVPQVQVFFVGLPLKVGLGFVTLAFSMGITLPVIREHLLSMAGNIAAVFN